MSMAATTATDFAGLKSKNDITDFQAKNEQQFSGVVEGIAKLQTDGIKKQEFNFASLLGGDTTQINSDQRAEELALGVSNSAPAKTINKSTVDVQHNLAKSDIFSEQDVKIMLAADATSLPINSPQSNS